MKFQIYRLKICLVLLLAFCHPGYASNITILTDHFEPIQIIEGDKISGIATDIVKMTLEQSKLEYQLEGALWSLTYSRVLKESNTCIYSIARTKERESLFHWIGKVIDLQSAVFTLVGKEVQINQIDDIKQYKTVVIKEDVAHQFLRSRRFESGKHYYAMDDYNAMLRFLKARTVQFDLMIVTDAWIELRAQNSELTQFVKVFEIPELRLGYYFACNKKLNMETVSRLKSSMSELELAGKFEKLRSFQTSHLFN